MRPQISIFILGQLKTKTFRKTFRISFNTFIQSFRFHIIKQCQIAINHNLLTTYIMNPILNFFFYAINYYRYIYIIRQINISYILIFEVANCDLK